VLRFYYKQVKHQKGVCSVSTASYKAARDGQCVDHSLGWACNPTPLLLTYLRHQALTTWRMSSMFVDQHIFVAWLCERSIPTERPPLVGEVTTFANRGVPHGQRDGSLRPHSRFPRPESIIFLSSSSSIVLTRLSGPRSRLNTFQIIW
jgi:hypothetical protein